MVCPQKIWLIMAVLLIGNALLFLVDCLRDPIDHSDYKRIKNEIIEQTITKETIDELEQKSEYGAAYDYVLQEVRMADSYRFYIDTIIKDAEERVKLKVYESDYDQVVFQKSIKDYCLLMDTNPQFVGGYGLEKALKHKGWFIFVCLFLTCIVYDRIIKEKENGVRELTKTTYYGGRELGICKLITVFSCCLVFIIINNLLIIFEANLLFGSVNMDAPVQSLLMFGKIGNNLSIWQVVLFVILIKSVVAAVIIAVLLLIADKSQNTLSYCVGFVLYLLINVLFQNTSIIRNSSFFQYSSCFIVLEIENLFDYGYVSVLGHPVLKSAWYSIVQLVWCILFSSAYIIVFGKTELKNYRIKRPRIKKNRKTKTRSVFAFELVKWTFHYKVLFMTVALLVVTVVYYSNQKTWYSLDGMYYKNYMMKLKGIYTEEKENYIQGEKEQLLHLRQRLDNLYGRLNTSNDYNTNEEIQKEIRVIQEKLEAEHAIILCERNANYLKKLEIENKGFVYEKGWYELFGAGDFRNDVVDGLFCIIPIIVGIAMLWTRDYRYRIETIEHGFLMIRKKMQSRIILSVLYVFLVFTVITVSRVVWCDSEYGLDSSELSVLSLMRFSGAHYSITILEYYGIVILIRLLSLALVSTVVIIIGVLLKNTYVTILVSSAIFIIPFVLNLVGIDYYMKPIVAMFSANLLLQ